ncbi:MAG: PAS domain S-box protein [Oligoflexus sp.]|nr:PAS domain S-box protein [Oligoflexus sp.]
MEDSRINTHSLVEGFQKSLATEGSHKNSTDPTLWSKVFAFAPVGVAIVGLNGYYKEANPAFLRLTGYTESELKKFHILDITHEDDIAQNKYLLEKLVKSELKNFRFEKRIIAKTAEIVWVRNTVALCRDEEDRPVNIVTVSEDITEQRQAEITIRNAEARLRATVTYTSVGISLMDLDLNFEDVNPAMCRMLGYKREELLKLNVTDVTHLDYRDAVSQSCQELLTSDTTFVRINKKCIRNDGSYFWAQNTLSIIKDENSKPINFVAVTEDTTSRVLAEQGLHRSQEKLALALCVSKVGFFNWDIFGDKVEFSKQVAEDFGLDGEPINLQGLLDIIHPDDRVKLSDMIQEFLKGDETGPKECRVLRPDGEIVWVDLKGHMTFDSDGRPLRFFGTSINITERKRIEDELRSGEERLRIFEERMRLATEAAKIGVWDLNPCTQALALSERAREILRLDSNGCSHSIKILRNILPEDRPLVKKSYREAMVPKGPGIFNVTNRFVTRNKSIRWLHSIGRTHFQGEGEERRAVRLLGTILDVTEQVQMEEALKAAKNAAEVANATKSAFLANMSHEIRTPLSAILGFSDLLLDNHYTVEEREHYLKTIIRNGRTLMHIIDDILDLSKVEAGHLDLEKVNIPFYKFMEEITDLFREKARSKDIFIELQVEECVPTLISSDPTRLRQILINLIGNAVKFTDIGGITVKVGSKFDEDNLLHLIISVHDTGIGLTEEQIQRIFKPFTQADNSTTRRFGGTGLGLYLAKRFALALGGDITLSDCNLGQGCTFELNFVAEMAKPYLGHEVFDQDRLNIEDMPLEGLKILVAEDAFDNQLLIHTILTGCGASVEIANNGLEAVYKASHGDFDIVLMDLQMPKMDGYEATESLRRQGYSKPILALTAHAMVEERQKTRRAGCDAHLTKPLDPKKLIEKIIVYAKKPFPFFYAESPSHFS